MDKYKIDHKNRYIILNSKPRAYGVLYINTIELYRFFQRYASSQEGMLLSDAMDKIGPVDRLPNAPPPYFIMKNGWKLQPQNCVKVVEVSEIILPETAESTVLAPRPDGKNIHPPQQIDRPKIWTILIPLIRSILAIIVACMAIFWWGSTTNSGLEPTYTGYAVLLYSIIDLINLFRGIYYCSTRR